MCDEEKLLYNVIHATFKYKIPFNKSVIDYLVSVDKKKIVLNTILSPDELLDLISIDCVNLFHIQDCITIYTHTPRTGKRLRYNLVYEKIIIYYVIPL